jgi:restriction system protein
VKNLEEGINKVSPFYYQESAIFCQAHTGNLGKNNRNKGGIDRVSKDWEKMSKFII